MPLQVILMLILISILIFRIIQIERLLFCQDKFRDQSCANLCFVNFSFLQRKNCISTSIQTYDIKEQIDIRVCQANLRQIVNCKKILPEILSDSYNIYSVSLNITYLFRMDSINSKVKHFLHPIKAPYYSRIGHRSIKVANHILILGGTNLNGQYVNSILRVSCATFNIEVVESQNGFSKEGFSLFSYKNRVFVWGGSRGEQINNELLEFDKGKFISIPQYGQVPSPRQYHGSTFFLGHYLIIFGGSDKQQFFNEWYLLDCDNFTWSKLKPSIQLPYSIDSRLHYTSGHGVLCLGSTYNTKLNKFAYNSSLFQFHLKKNHTLQISLIEKSNQIQPQPRNSPIITTIKNKFILLLGGQKIQPHSYDKYFDDVWCFDLELLFWQKLNINLQTKFGFQCCSFDGNAVLFGGVKNKSQLNQSIQTIYFSSCVNGSLCESCNHLAGYNCLNNIQTLQFTLQSYPALSELPKPEEFFNQIFTEKKKGISSQKDQEDTTNECRYQNGRKMLKANIS